MKPINPIYIFNLLGDFQPSVGDCNADDLHQRLNDLSLPTTLLDASTRIQLFDAVLFVKPECESNLGGVPVIHFYGHGGNDGIELRENNECVDWPILSNVVKPLHEAVHGNFILCFDTCSGLHGFKLLSAHIYLSRSAYL